MIYYPQPPEIEKKMNFEFEFAKPNQKRGKNTKKKSEYYEKNFKKRKY